MDIKFPESGKTHTRNEAQPFYTICNRPVAQVILAHPSYTGKVVPPAVPTCATCKKGKVN